MDVIPASDGVESEESPSHWPSPTVTAHDFVMGGAIQPNAPSSDDPILLNEQTDYQIQMEETTQPRRALRQRTAQQLAPFSVEAVRYIRTLTRRDWQDAVVIQKQRAEADSSELKAKKRALMERGVDDLDGWLELEPGMNVRPEPVPSVPTMAMPDAFARKRKWSEKEMREQKLRRALGIRQSSSEPDDSAVDRTLNPKKKPKKNRERQQSAPLSQSPGNRATFNVDDASSSPPVASTSTYKHRRSRSAQPSSKRSSRVIDLSDSDVQDSDNSDIETVTNRRPSDRSSDEEGVAAKFDLKGKRAKQLRGMMPGVFFKRAKADLELMAKEKAEGKRAPELYTRGSGDEQSEEEAEFDFEGSRTKAVVRKCPIDETEPFRLQGDTDSDDGVLRAPSSDDSSDHDADDAVSIWLNANAPRRKLPAPNQSKKKNNRDIIDRLLHQDRKHASKIRAKTARRKPRRRPLKERARNAAKAIDSEDDRDLQEELEDLHDMSPRPRGIATIRNSHHPVNMRSLADDDTLFNLVEISEEGPEELPPPPRHQFRTNQIPSVHLNVSSAVQNTSRRAPEAARWSGFSKFSYDFGIKRFPMRTHCKAGSYIAAGHLFHFLQLLKNSSAEAPRPATTFPFGIHLDAAMPLDALMDLLPRMCDNVIDRANDFATFDASSDAGPPNVHDGVEAIHFVGVYLKRTHLDSDPNALNSIQSQIDILERRLQAVEVAVERQLDFQLFLLPLRWILLELTIRMHLLLSFPMGALPTVDALLRRLIKALFTYGINRTGKSLKAHQESEEGALQDESHLAWIALINLCLVEKDPALDIGLPDEDRLWSLIEAELEEKQAADRMHPVIAAEASAYVAMMCCALSQISASGQVLVQPRMSARWSIVTKALDPISLEELQHESARLSNTEITRRDGYIWTLSARCLIFAHRWNWKLDSREALLPKIFDILNARSLKNSAIDGGREFPVFLTNYKGDPDTQLQPREDSTFHIFLKLLIRASREKDHLTTQEHDRHVARLLMRVTPVKRKVPYTRDAPILDKDRSSLINYYSLFLTFIVISPTVMSRRLAQMKTFLPYEEADDLSRPLIIRAMMYLALVFQKHQIALKPVIEWFSSICTFLRGQYAELEKKRALQHAPSAQVQRGMSAITHSAEREKESRELAKALFDIAVSITMILRAWQNIMVSAIAQDQYPDMGWLDHAWTCDILVSPIAQDPLVGIECLKCVQCFLGLRNKALESLKRPLQVSQDEFGFDEFDLNDPALNELIGYSADAGAADEKKAKDAAFAAQVKAQLSPAIWKLLSAIYMPNLDANRSAPVVGHQSQMRADYVHQVVRCWIACAAVLVDNGLRDWDSYLLFGEETFKRVSDPLGRREVGMLFGCCLYDVDFNAFARYADELTAIWWDSLVARRVTQQHQLTNQLLNTFADKDAFFGGIQLGKLGDAYEFSEESLKANRARLIDHVCSNMKGILNNTPSDMERVPSKETVLRLVNSMLGFMRDNLESFTIKEANAKSDYASFCQNVLKSLKETAGPKVNEQTCPNLRLLGGLAAS